MGGKGSDNYTPPPPQPAPDMAAMVAPMMGMMGAMASMSALPMPTLELPPPMESVPSVDWKAKQKEIQDKIATDTAAELKRRRGRSSTILTSPLADGEEIKTTSASMSGK